MKTIRFSQEKDELLRKTRQIGFKEIINALKNNKALKVIENPNKKKFPNQRLLLININKYVFVVPYVENRREIFLKTIYPSKKYTKKFIKS